MRLRDLPTNAKFSFIGSSVHYTYGGNGWYRRSTGSDGGPWHDDGLELEVERVYTYQLRRCNAGEFDNVNLLHLPVCFVGDWNECKAYAKENGWQWKINRNYLFDGYWVNENGDCLQPT